MLRIPDEERHRQSESRYSCIAKNTVVAVEGLCHTINRAPRLQAGPKRATNAGVVVAVLVKDFPVRSVQLCSSIHITLLSAPYIHTTDR